MPCPRSASNWLTALLVISPNERYYVTQVELNRRIIGLRSLKTNQSSGRFLWFHSKLPTKGTGRHKDFDPRVLQFLPLLQTRRTNVTGWQPQQLLTCTWRWALLRLPCAAALRPAWGTKASGQADTEVQGPLPTHLPRDPATLSGDTKALLLCSPHQTPWS